MGMRINTNLESLNAHKNLTRTDGLLGKSLERLSSGLRINKAADDASGLTIADTLKAQHTGISQAIANANDGVNIIQIADGALEESINIVNTIRTKSIQAASDAQNATSRKAIQADVDKLLEELEMIGDTTAFNGKNLLDGSFTNKSFHVGAYKDETISINIGDGRASKIGAMAYANTNRQAEAAVSNPFMKGGQVGSTALSNGDIRLNSVQIDANVQQLATYGDTDSAWSKAAAINAKLNESGVQAKATTEMIIDVTGDLSGVNLNGIDLGLADSDAKLVSLVNNNTTFKNMGIRAETFGSQVKIVADDGRNLNITTDAGFDTNTNGSAVKVNGINLVSATINDIVNRGSLTLSNARAMAGSENTIAAGTINSGDLVINGVDVAGGGALTVVAGDTDKNLLNAINNNKELQTLGIRAEQYRETGDAAGSFRLRLISEKEPLEISGVDPGKIAKMLPGTTQGIKTTGVLVEGSAVDANPTDDLLTKIGFEGARFGTRELDGASNTGGNDLSVVSKAYVAGSAVNSTAITAGDLYVNGVQIGASVNQVFSLTTADADADWGTVPTATASSAGGAVSGSYVFTSATAANIGAAPITVNWTGPEGATGSFVIPNGYTTGTKIAGPAGIELAFTAGDALVVGDEFELTATNYADQSSAFAKAAAINEKVNETGVAAKATTEMLIDVTGDLSGVVLNQVNLGLAATDAQLVSLVNNDVNFKNAGIKAELFDGQVRVRAEDGRDLTLQTNAATFDFAANGSAVKVNGINLLSGTANTITERGNLTLTNARAMANGETNIVAGTINQGEFIINGVDVAKGGSLTIQNGDSDRTLVNAVNNNTDLQKLGIRAELYKASGDTNFRMRLISERDDITVSGTDPNKVASFVSGTTTGKTATDIKLTGSLVDGSPTTDNYLDILGFGGSQYGTTEETGVNNTSGNDKMIFGKDRLNYSTGDVAINDYKIGESVNDGISDVLGDKSAAALAAAVNLVKDYTGVEADILKATQAGAGMVAAGTLQQGDLRINGVDIVRDNTGGSGMSILKGDANNTLINAINEYKDQTGVTASINGDGALVLSAVDGRNIHVQSTANGNKLVKFEADFGEGKGVAQDSVYMGNIKLVSDQSFTAEGTGSSNAQKEISLLKMGLAGGTASTEATSDQKGDGKIIAGVNYNTAMSKVDVTTQEGAEQAIRTSDYALKRLDEIRSGLGSTQNQLTSTIANLSVTRINVQGTESTIRDVDFAAESSNFSKMQVLMQAGTYAMSQANSTSQNVMRLLQ